MFLTRWPMTLTFELDLDILPLDLHAKIQVCMSVRLSIRLWERDRHTRTQTMPKLELLSQLKSPCRLSRPLDCRDRGLPIFHWLFTESKSDNSEGNYGPLKLKVAWYTFKSHLHACKLDVYTCMCLYHDFSIHTFKTNTTGAMYNGRQLFLEVL